MAPKAEWHCHWSLCECLGGAGFRIQPWIYIQKVNLSLQQYACWTEMDESRGWDPLISHFCLLRATRSEPVFPQQTAIVLYKVKQIQSSTGSTHLLLGITPARSLKSIPPAGKGRGKWKQILEALSLTVFFSFSFVSDLSCGLLGEWFASKPSRLAEA